jgi:RNA polymerase sigma factor (sigma-70 family)
MDDWLHLEKYSRTGDSDAFAALVNRHLGLVYATALRITGDPGAADDVSQATFILLEEKAEQLKPCGSLASWLYQTAVFKARKQVTMERKRREKEAKGAAAMMTNHAESTENEWSEIRPLIDAALESLAEEDRSIIISRHLEQMSLKDAGTSLGISEDAAGKRVARAGVRLREWFENRGVRCTADVLDGALGNFAMVAAPTHLADQVMASALGVSAGAATVHASGEMISNWLSSRTALVVAFAMAAATPVAVSVIHPEETSGSAGQATLDESRIGNSGAAAPLTADEEEWVKLWKSHAPPKGSYKQLLATILRIEDPLKRDVFKAVAYAEWVEKGLPIPANLEFHEAAPLFEQLLAKDPARAAELAASFNQGDGIPKYLPISSKLMSLVGKHPEDLAAFIKLVEIPSRQVIEYGLGSWQTVNTALPPLSDDERAGSIRDAVALLAERNPALAETTVDSLKGWHREQALAGLLIGQTGMDLDAAILALSERPESPAMKENVLQFLLTKWMEIDPRQAIAELDQLQKGDGVMPRVPSGKLYSSLTRSDLLAVYAERDFEGCMALLDEVGPGLGVGEKFYAAVAEHLREDPVSTLEAMEKFENKPGKVLFRQWIGLADRKTAPAVWDWCASREPNDFVRSVATSVLSANADEDPGLAIDLYLQNPDLATEFPGHAIAQAFNNYSVDEAKRILGRIPEKERIDTIHTMLRSEDLDWNVADCLDLYESLPNNHRDDPAEQIAFRLAESDPGAAVAWALSQPEGRIRNSSVKGLIGSWAELDPVAASEWVDQLESGITRESAAWQLADKLADQGDYESAIAWASSIADQKNRPGRINSIILRASKSESAEALEALFDQSGLSSDERKSLHEKIASEW